MISLNAANTALSMLQSMNSSSASDPILSVLYGGSTLGASGDPTQALQMAEKNQTQDIAAEAKTPAVKSAIDQFTTALSKATSLQQLLSNPIAAQVLLTANGLGDQTQYTALATKALMSDPSDPKSLANQLPDTRWLSMVKTYNFAQNGLSVLKDPNVISTITSGYAQVMWQQSLDQTTPGLSNALDFRSRASQITNVDQVLGDPTFRTVITTALGIPQQIAYQPLEAQEKAITSQLDLTKFQNPKFVEQFTQRYLLAENDAAQSSDSSASIGLSLLA